MIAVIFEFLNTSIGRWIVGSLIAATALAGAYGYLRVHYYNNGYAAALHAVAAQDQRAIDAANKAKDTVRDCRNSGGHWDSDGGVCSKS
jgi:uncharacterized protein (UPF0333 family)